MPNHAGRFLRWRAPFAHGEKSRYQFTLRSVLAFTVKCCCLLSVLLLSGDTLAGVAALPVFGVWMPFELVVSQTRGPRSPLAVSLLFLLARVLFVYGCCLVALAATLIGVSLTWTRPWTLHQNIGVVFGVAVLLQLAALVSLTSGAAAAVSWRWDRRARWLVYVNGGYLLILVAIVGIMELFQAVECWLA